MSSDQRRTDARRKAWGRGPVILPFESLEGRQLLATTPAAVSNPLPDLVATSFATTNNVDWGDTIKATGTIMNQGTAPTTAPVTVGVFASPTSVIGPTSVPIGSFTIPAGLGAGQSYPIDQSFNLPMIPVSGVGAATNNGVFVALRVDTTQAQQESDKFNNEGRGVGKDEAVVTITPPAPSNLVGSALAVTPTNPTWGQTVIITAQVKNNAQGDAPPTRARLVLTPSGATPGGAADFTVASLQIPAIPAWQTANISQQITLPKGPPSSLASANSFVLSMVQDADYVTNPLNNRATAAGLGIDQTILTIGANPDGYTAPITYPNIAPSNVSVIAPSSGLVWGTAFQATATLQNLGQADASQFRVRFLLTGTSGNMNQAVVLGDAIVPGMKAGATLNVNDTLKLPRRLPYGSNVSALAYGRIVVIVDPEQSLDQQVRSNNSAASAPVVLRVLGLDGSQTVPTQDPISTTATSTTTTTTTTATATPTKKTRAQLIAERKAYLAAHQPVQRRPHYQKPVPVKHDNSVIHVITNYQKKLNKALKDLTKI